MKKLMFSLLATCWLSIFLADPASAQATGCNTQFTSTDSAGVQFFTPTSYFPQCVYYWNFGDGTSYYGAYVNHQYTNAGVYNVCLTVYDSVNLCNNTWCDSVLISNSLPCAAGFTSQETGNQVQFAGYCNVSNVTTWYWDFGDGTTGNGQFPNHTYSSAGNYTACLTVTTSTLCTSTQCNTVTILGSGGCNAQFTYIDSTGYVFFYPTTVNTGNSLSFIWSFGDGTSSSQQYPVHQYNSAGPFGACLTIIDSTLGCTATYCDTVFPGSFATCVPSFGAQVTGNTIHLYGYSTAAFVVSWHWDFGDGTTANIQNPTHTYASTGYYNICLTVTTGTGCIGTYCQNYGIINTSGCSAQFSFGDSTGYTFFMPLMNSSAGNISYLWSFGDGTSSTQAFPIHQYSSVGPWTVCLIVTDSIQNCTATWCTTVSAGGTPNCNANFVYTVDSMGTVLFTNVSTTNGINPHYYWDLGDGTIDTTENPIHFYAIPGPYVVCLTISGYSNCQSTTCDTIQVGNVANCVPSFYSYPDSTSGNGNMNFGIYNNCPGYTYVWNFGDSTSSSGTTPVHFYNVTGWFTVCCTAIDPSGNTTDFCDSVFAFRIGHYAGIAEMKSQLPVQLYPNPTTGPIALKFHLNTKENVQVDVIGIDGKKYSHLNVTLNSGDQELKIDQSALANGLYLLYLRAGDQHATVRVSIAH